MCEISIIIPVYRVEEYLEKCLDSILEQTFQDYEIIIVDDGSNDRSGQIADHYAERDSRIRVIHKSNGGAASARNAGIDISRGKYLYFPDSDDWIENDYLCDLYKTARKTRSKLVISGFVMEYAEGNVKQHFCVIPDRCDYSSLQEVRLNLHKYFDNMMMAVPWNKLYEAEYVRNNNIRFPNTNWDDMFFNLEVIRDIDHVAISSSNGYHYFRSRNQSETRKVFDTQLYSKRREQFLYILDVYQYWGINDTKIDAVLQGYYAGRLVQCIQEIASSELKYSTKRKAIREILNDDMNHLAFLNGKIPSKLLSVAAIPAKHKMVLLSILIGNCISFIKKTHPEIFNRLKSVSVNKAIEQKQYTL